MDEEEVKIELITPHEVTAEDLKWWGVLRVKNMTREEMEEKFPSPPKRS